MSIFLYILPAPLLALIFYFALSRKSTPLIKRTALIALILVGLSVLASLLVVFGEPMGKAGPAPAAVPVESVVPQESNIGAIIAFAVSLFVFLALIIFLSAREHRRLLKKEGVPEFPGADRKD
jgi:formate hydrogenlyase subunit 3/multisubunit Na+/H+ antiporter MnhD subunit